MLHYNKLYRLFFVNTVKFLCRGDLLMEKLTCIMDCKKETQAVRFLSKCAIVYSAIAGIISFVGTILSIISATESRADSFSEILYAFLPTIIACGICLSLGLLFLALSSILHALTTSARIAELRATRDGVPYTDVYNTIRTKSTPPIHQAPTHKSAPAPTGSRGWICPKCGERSTGGFCGACGEKSPF